MKQQKPARAEQRPEKKNHSEPRRGIGWKVFLGVLFSVGSIIILLAAFLLVSLFFSPNISNRVLTSTPEEFLALYEENYMERDLPNGLAITDSSCRLEEDIYVLNVSVKNIGSSAKRLQMQIYYTPEFEAAHRGSNPFVRFSADDGLVLEAGEEKSFTVRGYLGSSREAAGEQLSRLYFEVLTDSGQGRIMLPVTVTETRS